VKKGPDVILAAWNGGLGDQLQFSTLPEEFYKQHGRETYLLDGTEFRNKEIYDLVWGLNPYIKGSKIGKWSAGDTPEIILTNCNNNWISSWESAHGLDPKNKYPKIYYEPNKIEGYEDTILVDFTATSLKFDGVGNGYDIEKLNKSFREVKSNYQNKKFVVVKFEKDINEAKIQVDCDEQVVVKSIFHYCDLMYSSSGLCGLHSGSTALASAVKRYNEDLDIFVFVSETLYANMQKWLGGELNFGAFYLDYINYVITK
jgi:hypothetical protein